MSLHGPKLSTERAPSTMGSMPGAISCTPTLVPARSSSVWWGSVLLWSGLPPTASSSVIHGLLICPALLRILDRPEDGLPEWRDYYEGLSMGVLSEAEAAEWRAASGRIGSGAPTRPTSCGCPVCSAWSGPLGSQTPRAHRDPRTRRLSLHAHHSAGGTPDAAAACPVVGYSRVCIGLRSSGRCAGDENWGRVLAGDVGYTLVRVSP
jgi:hypothetical protein